MSRMSLDDFGALLPNTFEDFRNVEFWDGFFKACNQKPFEWYGEWKQLREFMLPILEEAQDILVIGCGNSDLSADMYDEGCTAITNIDFSIPVIKEMMQKNLRKRPLMKWKVMDMTQTKFEDGAFEVIVDKGGLDALMGEDTPGSEEAGAKLLAEVTRLLAPEGAVYLCVTLAQPHVLRKLLGAFGAGWQVVLDQVPPTADMAGATLQPILATVARLGPNYGAPPVQVGFQPEAGMPNAEQLADICQVVEEESAARRATDAALQQDTWALLHPGRRVVLELDAAHRGTGNGAASGVASTSGRDEAYASQNRSARYTATVLDVDVEEADEEPVRDCCVFIVPQGRESDWLFATEEGQWQVAGECGAHRIILVTLGRGHVYGGVTSVNKELSPLVRDLAPLSVRGDEMAVPILSAAEGIGERRVLEDVHSDINGRIVVEDVRMRPDSQQGGNEPLWLRRMVFVSNRGLIQSEAHLMPQQEGGGRPGSGKKGQGKAARAGSVDGAAAPAPLVPSYAVLACEYHISMVAGLSLISGGLLARRAASPADAGRALVIGLGGGPLPIYWHASLGFNVEAVELDPVVLELAWTRFGFLEKAEAPSLTARVGDGLAAVAERAAAVRDEGAPKLDVLIVDASSGDPTLAMPCPSPAFLEPPFLADARACLREDGLLMVNCVSRSEAAYAGAVAALRAVFAQVYELGAVEDVNRVLFCAPAPLVDAGAPNGSWAAAVVAATRLLALSPAADDPADAPDSLDTPLLEQLQRLRLLPPAP